MICFYKTLNLQKRYPELQQNNKPILPALSYFSGNGSAAIDKPCLTLFQKDACRHEAKPTGVLTIFPKSYLVNVKFSV